MISSEVRRLLILAAAAFGVLVVVYLVAVQTTIGQRLDDAALAGGRSTPESAQTTADELLRIVSVGSLVAAVGVLSAFAWLRRRPGLLLVPAAVVGASLLGTELLKLVVLDRPPLHLETTLPQNSYPSGHTTVAVSLGLAATIVSPARLRPLIGLGAALLAAAAGVFVVTADWHRPSDPIGSFAISLGVAAIVLAVLRTRHDPRRTAEQPSGGPAAGSGAVRIELTTLLVGAATFVASLVVASLKYGSEVDWNRFHAAFLLAALAIVVAAGLTFGALLRAIAPSVRSRGTSARHGAGLDSVPGYAASRPPNRGERYVR